MATPPEKRLHAARARGFEVLPLRWIVERTFAWLGRSRRLSKDYEGIIETAAAYLRIAMIQLMLRRLARRADRGL